MVQGGDNGTPLQKDEPHAENPPVGATIDYYLARSATGPVTLDIIDSTGATVFTYSTVQGAGTQPSTRRRASAGGIPNVSDLWRVPPEPFSGSAGMHRVVWAPIIRRQGVDADGDPLRPTLLHGTFTARLSVGGRVLTQTFVVKPDPRKLPQ